MIGWAQLREAARAAPQDPDIDQITKKVAARRLQLGDVGRRATWPAGAEVRAALTRAKDAHDQADFARLADLIQQPHRALVLRAEEGEERYALLGSWTGPEIGWVAVRIRPNEAAADRTLDLSFAALPSDAPGLADELQALYSSIDPRHRPKKDFERRTLDRALWIGGSAGEAEDEHWEHRIAALLGSRGLDMEVFARPGDATLDRALRQVEGFRGPVTIIWSPRAGDSERRARLAAAATQTSIVLEEPDFELALVEAAVALDKRDQDRAEEVDGVGTPDKDPDKPLSGGPFYFKKTGTGRGTYGDRMQKMAGPCIHDNFRRARRPDQAKRGIARVAQADPIKLEHCESCTGGGFWRAWF